MMKEHEFAREGYRAALAMISHEAKVIWDSFRSMIAVNTIFIGFIGAALKLYPDFRIIPIGIAVVGIAMCIAWTLISKRAFGYYAYWFAWARKYEGVALGGENHIIQLGQVYSNGETVREVNLRFSWSARLFRVQWLTYTVIVSFVVVYTLLLVELVKKGAQAP